MYICDDNGEIFYDEIEENIFFSEGAEGDTVFMDISHNSTARNTSTHSEYTN